MDFLVQNFIQVQIRKKTEENPKNQMSVIEMPKNGQILCPKAQIEAVFWGVFFSILLTHKGSHREVYQDIQPSLTPSAGDAKG